MEASTPTLEAGSLEKNRYDQLALCHHHAYAVLDFKDHDGHHLIQIGNTNAKRWNGKWSLMPGYDYEFFREFSFDDRLKAALQTFWMEIDDFLRYFQCIAVCEYREGWHERRFKQVIERKSGQKSQIVRLHVAARQEYVIEVDKREEDGHSYRHNLFINVHKSTSNDQCGELLHAFDEFHSRISTPSFRLNPGVYFVVFICFERPEKLEVDWVIRCQNPLDPSTIQFVDCPFSTLVESLQQVILVHGKSEAREKSNIIVYTWHGRNNYFMMVENKRKWSYARVRVTEVSATTDDPDKCSRGGAIYYENWWPVPPGSRCIVAKMSNVKRKIRTDEISYQCQISSWFRALIDWIDSTVYHSGFEKSASLITVN